MTRIIDPHALVSLPRLDANQAVVLALALEAAALDENKQPLVLPESVSAALVEVKADRESLQDTLGGSDPEKLGPLDKQEDNAIAALILVLLGWSRVKDQFDLGAVAASVGNALGADDGLGFINIRPRDEYGVIETKLKTIERENLEPKLDSLGLAPLLAHLRDVHAAYGKALGLTQPLPAERSAIRARYDALHESLREYIAAVMGSRQRKKPETKALADALLRPLVEWRPDAPPKPSKDATPPAPPTTTDGTAEAPSKPPV